jgi:hypothetical protein
VRKDKMGDELTKALAASLSGSLFKQRHSGRDCRNPSYRDVKCEIPMLAHSGTTMLDEVSEVFATKFSNIFILNVKAGINNCEFIR